VCSSDLKNQNLIFMRAKRKKRKNIKDEDF